MPTIEIENELKDLESIKNVVTVTRNLNSMTFKGDRDVLKRIVFCAADAIWPSWFFSQQGRSTFLGYAEACTDGELTWHNREFAAVWPRVQKHLQVDGVIIANMPPS